MAQRRVSAELFVPNHRDVYIAMINDITSGRKCDIVQLLQSGALAISGAGSPLAKTGSIAYLVSLNAAGAPVIVKLAAANLPALVGSVTNAKFNVFCFFVDSTGTVTVAMGTEGATLGAVVFPTFPDNNACVGIVVINPTGTGPFVGGTTNLDDATVVPNAVYLNPLGAFKPTATASIIP